MKQKSVSEYLPANIWLMKTEPDVFSISDLEKRGTEKWDGVRNYVARNFMRDEMKVGDKVLFYHSNANPSGIVGEAEIVKGAEPDVTALSPKSQYYDPKATKEDPRWVVVTVGKPKRYAHIISLEMLRECDELSDMLVLRKGQRLSILPVSKEEYAVVKRLAQKKQKE